MMAHASRNEMTALLEAGEASVRAADWDGMRLVILKVPAGTDFGPLLKGLPDDRCPSPHWGYVLKGRLRIDQGGAEEVIQAGDTFYLPAGHTGVAEEDFECVELSPLGPHQQAMAVILKNAGLA
jgi:hypothetical protein